MARIPAKMIERKLKKEGVILEGYYILDLIHRESIRCGIEEEGMTDGITEPFEFEVSVHLDGVQLEFDCSMEEDYREINGEEYPYYYLYVDSCRIVNSDKEDQVIVLDVFER